MQTWVLNNDILASNETFATSFTSNGVRYTQITIVIDGNLYLKYNNEIVYSLFPIGTERWVDQKFRTLVFDISPTGALATWLSQNGYNLSNRNRILGIGNVDQG